jgi:hypothetical protein
MDTARRARRRWLLAAALLGLPLAGLGHAIAYVCRYGTYGWVLQGEGVHAYFPQLFALTGAGLGALLVVALLAGGLGHVMLSRGVGLRPAPGQPVVDLLLTVAAVQLQAYLVQETIEALAGGAHLDAAWLAATLGWGALGQLPVAALAALGLAWLSTRFHPALAGLRSLWHACGVALAPEPILAIRPAPRPDASIALAVAAPAALAKRGPPCRR